MHRYFVATLGLLLTVLAARAEGGKPENDPQNQKPTGARSKYHALVAEYTKVSKESDEAYQKAKTDEDRKKLRAAWLRARSDFVARFLAVAEARPKDREALLALYFVLHLDTEAEARHLDAAARLVLKDHVASDRLTNPPILQMLDDSPAGERLLRGVLEKSPHRAFRARAALSLALMLNGRAHPRRAGVRPPGNAAALAKEAEELFERVATKYADAGEVAEKAEAELFEIRHLVVGKVMPDIKGKDGDGKEIKLSDYRGKVVVLNYWATWCAPCVAALPHKQTLANQLKDKPFALVGVNRDRDRESLKKAEEKHKITWRSFFDGVEGRIAKRHNVQFMPTTYVLDDKGVIRYKGVNGEALDRAVGQLLAEVANGTKK